MVRNVIYVHRIFKDVEHVMREFQDLFVLNVSIRHMYLMKVYVLVVLILRVVYSAVIKLNVMFVSLLTFLMIWEFVRPAMCWFLDVMCVPITKNVRPVLMVFKRRKIIYV